MAQGCRETRARGGSPETGRRWADQRQGAGSQEEAGSPRGDRAVRKLAIHQGPRGRHTLRAVPGLDPRAGRRQPGEIDRREIPRDPAPPAYPYAERHGEPAHSVGHGGEAARRRPTDRRLRRALTPEHVRCRRDRMRRHLEGGLDLEVTRRKGCAQAVTRAVLSTSTATPTRRAAFAMAAPPPGRRSPASAAGVPTPADRAIEGASSRFAKWPKLRYPISRQ